MAIQDPHNQPAVAGQHFEPGQNQYEVREVSPGVGKLFLNGQACTIKIGGEIVTDPKQLKRIGKVAENSLGKLDLEAGQKLRLTSTTATVLKQNGRSVIKQIDIHDSVKPQFQTKMNKIFLKQTELTNDLAQGRGIAHTNPPVEQRAQRRDSGPPIVLEPVEESGVAPPEGLPPPPVPERRPPELQPNPQPVRQEALPEDETTSLGLPQIGLPQYEQTAEQPFEFVIELDETSEEPIARGSPPPRPERKQMTPPQVEHPPEEVVEEVVVEELPEPRAYAPPPPPQQKNSENLDVDTPPPPPAPDDVEIETGDEEAPPPPPPDEQFEILPDYDLDAPPPPPPDEIKEVAENLTHVDQSEADLHPVLGGTFDTVIAERQADEPPPPPNAPPPPQVTAKASQANTSALFDEIKKGNAQLKHVEPPSENKKSSEPTGLAADLTVSMAARRAAVAKDDEDGPDDIEEDDDGDVKTTSSQEQQAPVAKSATPPPPVVETVTAQPKTTPEASTTTEGVPLPPPPPAPGSSTPPVSPNITRAKQTGATTTLADELANAKLKSTGSAVSSKIEEDATGLTGSLESSPAFKRAQEQEAARKAAEAKKTSEPAKNDGDDWETG